MAEALVEVVKEVVHGQYVMKLASYLGLVARKSYENYNLRQASLEAFSLAVRAAAAAFSWIWRTTSARACIVVARSRGMADDMADQVT